MTRSISTAFAAPLFLMVAAGACVPNARSGVQIAKR